MDVLRSRAVLRLEASTAGLEADAALRWLSLAVAWPTVPNEGSKRAERLHSLILE